MNLYVVIEDEVGAKKVYGSWISYLNPSLQQVTYLSQVQQNNYFIVSGGGYPSYFEVIDDAIADVNALGNIDRLVVAVDSEEMSFQEKHHEIQDFLTGKKCKAEIFIVVQHFCFETWGLGNRRIGPRKPRNDTLIRFKGIHNVLIYDPELLPPCEEDCLNRSQFAFKYLRLLLAEKHRNLSYTKSNPAPLLHPKYFAEVRKRLEETGHIGSFSTFVKAFS